MRGSGNGSPPSNYPELQKEFAPQAKSWVRESKRWRNRTKRGLPIILIVAYVLLERYWPPHPYMLPNLHYGPALFAMAGAWLVTRAEGAFVVFAGVMSMIGWTVWHDPSRCAEAWVWFTAVFLSLGSLPAAAIWGARQDRYLPPAPKLKFRSSMKRRCQRIVRRWGAPFADGEELHCRAGQKPEPGARVFLLFRVGDASPDQLPQTLAPSDQKEGEAEAA